MKQRHFDQLPKPYAAYGRVLKGLVLKPKNRQNTLPEVEYVVDRLLIDSKHLAAYRKVCGFGQPDRLPATYLSVLSQSLQMAMMTEEAFPWPVMGLVHIANQVRQYRPIGPQETLKLSVRFGDTRPHDKGTAFDFLTTAHSGSELVWEGRSTYLARHKTSTSGEKTGKPEEASKGNPTQQAIWNIADNIGRRYGLVSGDLNPIHVHHLTARAFGFPRAIAHGMWTKARCLAEMGALPDAFTVEVQFKLPVLLPAKVEYKAWQDPQGTRFGLSEASTGKPHLSGQLAVG